MPVSLHPETPDGDSVVYMESAAFFSVARKPKGCAEAYIGTPHKKACGLTTPQPKKAVSE
jgi:hypothetical protein